MATLKALIIAGGGGGGSTNGGGGGAGGYQQDDAIVVTPQVYAIVVGGGGTGALTPNFRGVSGDNSSAFGITSTGGGGGGSGSITSGLNGGSGGGAVASASEGNGTAGQGNDGGIPAGDGSGGGGAGGAGGVSSPSTGGNGGAGTTSSISGSAVERGGGGGGGTNGTPGTASGGGGAGGAGSTVGTPGTANTGGGGGGGGSVSGTDGGSGGSGVVIISYVTADFLAIGWGSTGGVITTDGANTVHTFNTSGDFEITVLPPSAVTYATTAVTKTTATANGEIIRDGNETILEMGFVYNTAPNPTIADTKVLAPNAVGPYSEDLTGLTPNTLYYLRAFITVGSGTYYGNQVTFTMLPPVTIFTYDATEIEKTSAVANGEITDDGGDTITERGFVWDTTINPTTADDKVIVAGTLGVYEGDMDSLTPDTLYYFRAYAITAAGTSYGENRTFTTLNVIARVGALNTGFTDYDDPIYFEMIDRWRSFTEMYSKSKSISGISFYTENAAGVRTYFQKQKAVPNAWEDLGTITEANNALFPNANTEDFDVGRIRIAGFTEGTPVVFHSMEILSINDKGFDQN